MHALSRLMLERLIEQQLGRKPAIPFEAEVYCGFGWPAVIGSDPYTLTGAPNPNLYYLTCPHLRREIAVLEDRGWITKLEQMAIAAGDLAEEIIDAQRQHAACWESQAGQPWPDSASGNAPRIAAAAADLSLKCLHAHMAWHLVHGDYFPGRIMLAQIGNQWCRDERCRAFDGASGEDAGDG